MIAIAIFSLCFISLLGVITNHLARRANLKSSKLNAEYMNYVLSGERKKVVSRLNDMENYAVKKIIEIEKTIKELKDGFDIK